MVATPAQRFWSRTRRLAATVLVLWLLLNLAVPWFARDLNAWEWFGFPLGYWMAAQGGLLAYLAMTVVCVALMERYEDDFGAESARLDAAADASGRAAAGQD